MKVIETISHSYADINLIAQLKLSKLECSDSPVKIIPYEEIQKEINKNFIDKLKGERTVCLLETRKDYWVTLSVVKSNADCCKTLVHFVSPKKSFVPKIIKNNLNCDHLELKVVPSELENYDLPYHSTDLNWIYSLYYQYAQIMKESVSYVISEEECSLFERGIIDILKQITKLRNKIKVCYETFANANKNFVPIISDFWCGNLFVFFLESLALEDTTITDNDLKILWENILGEENLRIIKHLRSSLFLHRQENKPCVIFPQDIHKTIFSGVSCRSVFNNLGLYLNKIVNILEGHKNNDKIKEPKDILQDIDKVGNYIKIEDIQEVLSDYSLHFIKEFSHQAEEIMFNFRVNFWPLMHLWSGNNKNLLGKDVIALRNQLVHNIYGLYHASSELPSISIQRLFPDLKKEFLIFNLSLRLSTVLKEFPGNGRSGDLEEKLKSCFSKFREEFTQELNQQDGLIWTNLTGQHYSRKIQLTFLIKFYLNSFSVLSEDSEININDLKIAGFSLLPEYKKFTDEQIRKIFGHFFLIKQIHDNQKKKSLPFIKEAFDVFVQNMQNDLKVSIGLKESDFETLYEIAFSEEKQNDKIAEVVLKHIMTIENECSETLNLKEAFTDYENVMNSIEIRNNTTKMKFRNLRMSNKNYDLCILGKSESIHVATIVKNVISVLYDLTSKDISILGSLPEALNDKLLLGMLATQSLNAMEIKKHATEISYLVPLVTELLINGKFKLNPSEEMDCIESCILPLLKPPNHPEHLINLLKLDKKRDKFLDECYKHILENIGTLCINSLHTLFENEHFERKTSNKLLKSKMEKSNEVFLILKLMDYKYHKSVESYKQRECKEALEYIDGKRGYSKLLQCMIEKKYITPDTPYIMEMELHKVKAKNSFALSEQKKFSQEKKKKVKKGEWTKEYVQMKNEEFKKHFDSAQKILDALMEKAKKMDNPHWDLKLSEYTAYWLHMQSQYKNSLTKYKEVLLRICNINRVIPVNNIDKVQLTPDTVTALMKSKEYKTATNRFYNLGVLKLWNNVAYELSWLGKRDRKDCIKAIEEAIKAHKIQREILGQCHPITLTSLSIIAESSSTLCNPRRKNKLNKRTEKMVNESHASALECYEPYKKIDISFFFKNKKIHSSFKTVDKYHNKVECSTTVKLRSEIPVLGSVELLGEDKGSERGRGQE